MEIGERFKAIREKKKLTQQQIAVRIGQARQIIARYEAIGSNPKWDTIRQMLGALDVTLPEFFESRIPDHYENPEHQDLHEQLQEILETGDEHQAECIKTAVRTFHSAITTARTAPRGKNVAQHEPRASHSPHGVLSDMMCWRMNKALDRSAERMGPGEQWRKR